MDMGVLAEWGLPENLAVGRDGVDRLINVLHVFMVLLFGAWGIFFVYCLARFRARPGHQASYDLIKAKPSKYAEIGIVIFEVVLLLGLSMPVWAEVKNEFPPEDEALVIRVVAEQFAWNIHYPGADGKFGKTRPELIDSTDNPLGLDEEDENGADDVLSINLLHMPAGKPVIARLSSKDVIHCFWIPVLRVKQDVVPGMQIPVWFEAIEKAGVPGEPQVHDLACAQLCGAQHSAMSLGRAIIHTQEDFDAWYAEQGEGEEFLEDEEFDDEDEEEMDEEEAEKADEPAEEMKTDAGEPPAADAGKEEETKAADADAPVSGTVVAGQVNFKGKAPKRTALKMDADAHCKAAHAGNPVGSETVIVNSNNTLKNVIVYVKEGLSGNFPVPPDKPVIDQKGCIYEPHVLSCMVKQPVIVRNSDATLHNIHGLPKKNAVFNFAQPRVNMEKEMSFTKEEFFRVKCDVHPWMSAWVGVFKHPFHSVTDGMGAFQIQGLPPGKYVIGAWHEKYGEVTQAVTVEKDKATKFDLTMAPK